MQILGDFSIALNGPFCSFYILIVVQNVQINSNQCISTKYFYWRTWMRTSETSLRPLHLQRKGTPVPQLNSYSLPNDFIKLVIFITIYVWRRCFSILPTYVLSVPFWLITYQSKMIQTHPNRRKSCINIIFLFCQNLLNNLKMPTICIYGKKREY